MTVQTDYIRQLQAQEQTLLCLRAKLNRENRNTSSLIKNGYVNAANKAQSEISNIENEINDLKENIKRTKTYINLKIRSVINFENPETEITKIADTTPILLFPVRLQTKFFKASDTCQIWIRIYPDNLSVDSHEKLLTEDEYLLGCQYVREMHAIGKPGVIKPEERHKAAWQDLATKSNSQRAAWIKRMFLGNKNDITEAGDIAINPDRKYITNWPVGKIGEEEPLFKEITDITLKPESWSQPSQSYLMPDRFAVLLYRGGNLIQQCWGNPIPHPLIAGHNPFPDGETNNLFDVDTGWIANFEEAKKNGMGLAIDITTEDYEQGFSKIMAVGIKASIDSSICSELIQQWVESHHYTEGFAFIPQGTPTNNTEKGKTPYSTAENYEKSYNIETISNINDLDEKSDIIRIAAALNIPGYIFDHIENNDLKENEEFKKVQNALWEKTWHYYLFNILNLNKDIIDKIKEYYLSFVSSRGPFPAIRVGKNPYGILPITATSKWKSHSIFLNNLCQILLKLYTFWKTASENPELTPHVGGTNDPEKELVRILGMDGKAQEIRLRNIVTFDYLWNLLRFTRKQLKTSSLPYAFDQQLTNNSVETNLKTWWAEVNKIKDQNKKILDDLGLTKKTAVLETIAWGSGYNIEDYIAENEIKISLGEWLFRFLTGSEPPNNITIDKLDILLREILDLSTHRLDSWITSLASASLDSIRKSKKDICIGAYGYLEDVKPKIQNSEQGGYIHCPSINQAKTAAVLRSAYINHKGKENEKALAINLSSNKVRRALWILEGIHEGQNLSTLLGYQFEKALHENYIGSTIYLDQYISPFRELYPISESIHNSEDDKVSSKTIIARNVVDGYNLVKRWQAKEIPFGKDNSGLPHENSPEYIALISELDALEETYDVFSDLTISESVHQLLQGNYTRSGAWMNAVSCSGLPSEPEIIKTPRSGIELRQRIVLIFKDSPVTDSQKTFSKNWPVTPRGRMEPNLSEWVARMLGNTDNIKCQVFWKQNDGIEKDDIISLSDVNNNEYTNIGPLDFLDLSVSIIPGGASELEQRIAYYIVKTKNIINPNTEIRIKFQIKTTNTDDRSFSDIIELSKRIRNFISNGQCPYLKPDDLCLPEEIKNKNRNFNTDIILNRLRLLINNFNSITNNLSQNTDIENNLFLLSQFGIIDIIPIGKDLKSLKEYALEKAKKISDSCKYINDNNISLTLSDCLAISKVLFGKNYTFLPSFNISDNIELLNACNTSSVNTVASNIKDAWVQQLAHTKPNLKQFETNVMIAKALSGVKIKSNIIQLPFNAEKEDWIALGKNPENIGSKMSICAYTMDDFIIDNVANDNIAGIVIEKWDNEMIPGDKEDTGLVFNYNQPSSEPPQALLVAVSPVIQKDDGVWSWDNLVASISETFELVKIRAVDSDSLKELSTFIPAIYKEIELSSLIQ